MRTIDLYHSLTAEQKTLFHQNHKKAVEYFNLQPGYVLHHKDEALRENDIDRYIQWLPEDLVVLTKAEHTLLHKPHLGKSVSEEAKNKIRQKLTGVKLSDERREAISSSIRNLKDFHSCGKKVLCVETNIIYPSALNASKMTGVNNIVISACLRGEAKTAGGYHWRKVDEE